MKTVEGMVMAGVLTFKLTVTPSAGAALLKVTVPVAEPPDGVEDGLMLKPATVDGLLSPAGLTARVPVPLVPPVEAVIAT